MVRFLTRAGLGVMIISVLALIVVNTEMGGENQGLIKTALLAGAGLFLAGLVLGLLARLFNIRFGRRCPRCRHRVLPGHVYCEDHFQESLNRARDHLAGRL